jgi:hypothetical protein
MLTRSQVQPDVGCTTDPSRRTLDRTGEAG